MMTVFSIGGVITIAFVLIKEIRNPLLKLLIALIGLIVLIFLLI